MAKKEKIEMSWSMADEIRARLHMADLLLTTVGNNAPEPYRELYQQQGVKAFKAMNKLRKLMGLKVTMKWHPNDPEFIKYCEELKKKHGL